MAARSDSTKKVLAWGLTYRLRAVRLGASFLARPWLWPSGLMGLVAGCAPGGGQPDADDIASQADGHAEPQWVASAGDAAPGDTGMAGEVARVGAQTVSRATIERIVAAQQVSPAQALELAIRDALFARAGAVDRDVFRRFRSAALARAQLELLTDDARAQGPPSDEEVAKLTALHWLETDRPPLRRTTHAVVELKQDTDRGLARRVAEGLAEATASSRSAEAFREAAEGFVESLSGPGQKLSILIEDLEPVAADGRAADPAAPTPAGAPVHFDPDFVHAVFALEAVGSSSPIVDSAFGHHVILLTELIDEKRLSLAQRRDLFASEVYMQRARALQDALLEGLRQTQPPVVSHNADALTELVQPQGIASAAAPQLSKPQPSN